ncbi:hypothetical protein N836_17910 [Leptolyngbya sp. Heron Island J]|nr:hypothetical protein N836_17910 [Leptolyngbya sp. Heron Island J]
MGTQHSSYLKGNLAKFRLAEMLKNSSFDRFATTINLFFFSFAVLAALNYVQAQPCSSL